MSHTQDKEEMKTSIEDRYRASLQRHRAANVVLSLLLLSSVAILAGVILTDGFGLCEQTGLVPVSSNRACNHIVHTKYYNYLYHAIIYLLRGVAVGIGTRHNLHNRHLILGI